MLEAGQMPAKMKRANTELGRKGPWASVDLNTVAGPQWDKYETVTVHD